MNLQGSQTRSAGFGLAGAFKTIMNLQGSQTSNFVKKSSLAVPNYESYCKYGVIQNSIIQPSLSKTITFSKAIKDFPVHSISNRLIFS